MTKIQITLTEEENKIINIVKATQGFTTKEETIRWIISRFKPKIK